MDRTTDRAETDGASSYWRRLLHRWLIEYNPLYLLSAALVLGGMILVSRGLAHEGSLYGQLGVGAIAELYALALIGGAALLTRIGHRRPAVMLAILTIVYQCDLSLHTESSAYYGSVGWWASATWLALFVAKLYALAWAMKLHLSRAVVATATAGAFGLAIVPHLLSRLDPRGGSALVGLFVFAVVALFSRCRPGDVTSKETLDAWGSTVLRRSIRTAWLILGGLLAFHVLFWTTHSSVRLVALLPALPLALVFWIRSEARVWAVVLATLLFAAALPPVFSLSALLAAVALGVRAVSVARASAASADPASSTPTPYRAFAPNAPPADAPAPLFVPVSRAAKLRFVTGAVFAAYLSAWTLGWSRGPWPAHVLALDLALTVVVLLLVYKPRVRIALAPLAASYAHLVVQMRLIPPPRSSLEWGASAVGLGFVLLLASLAVSYRLRDPAAASLRQ